MEARVRDSRQGDKQVQQDSRRGEAELQDVKDAQRWVPHVHVHGGRFDLLVSS